MLFGRDKGVEAHIKVSKIQLTQNAIQTSGLEHTFRFVGLCLQGSTPPYLDARLPNSSFQILSNFILEISGCILLCRFELKI